MHWGILMGAINGQLAGFVSGLYSLVGSLDSEYGDHTRQKLFSVNCINRRDGLLAQRHPNLVLTSLQVRAKRKGRFLFRRRAFHKIRAH